MSSQGITEFESALTEEQVGQGLSNMSDPVNKNGGTPEIETILQGYLESMYINDPGIAAVHITAFSNALEKTE